MRQNSSNYQNHCGQRELILGPAAGYADFPMGPQYQPLLQQVCMNRSGWWGRVAAAAVFSRAAHRRKKERRGPT
jgi:hypothetical protein